MKTLYSVLLCTLITAMSFGQEQNETKKDTTNQKVTKLRRSYCYWKIKNRSCINNCF